MFAEADEQAVVAAVVEQVTKLNQGKRNKMYLWQESIYAWERKFGDTWGEIADNRSHRYIPTGFQVASTAVAQYMQALMPADRFFKAVGRNKIAQANSFSLEAKLRWDFYRTDFRDTFEKFLISCVVTGQAIYTVQWVKESTQIVDEEAAAAKYELEQAGQTVELNDPANLGVPTKSIETFAGAKLFVGDPFNYVQERSPDDDRYAFRAYRSERTKEYIETYWGPLKDAGGRPLYKNIESIQSGEITADCNDDLKRAIETSMGYSPLPKDKVEIITFCGNLIVPGKGLYPNCFGVIANRRTLLRFCYNPFAFGIPPWQCFVLNPDPFDPYGYGIGKVEPILGLQDIINVRSNQTIDANAIAITPPLNVVLDGITDTRQIVWGPGQKLYSRAAGNIAPIQVNERALNLGLQEIQYYKSEVASTAGVYGSTSATPEGASATEAGGLQKVAGTVSAKEAKRIETLGLNKILRMAAAMNQQCFDPNSKVSVRLFVDETGRVTNPANGQTLPNGIHWAEIGFSDIQGEFDYEFISASSLAQTGTQIQTQMQFVQTASQDPVFAQRFDKGKWYVSVMDKIGFVDAWSFMKSDEQVQYEQWLEQQRAAAAAAAQGGSGNPSLGNQGGPAGPQGPGPAPGVRGVPSLPGSAGGGGSPARAPFDAQRIGPSRME